MAPKELPRIILKGDEEAASHMAREGIRQLGILEELMGFGSLQQDVRKVEYIDGSRIVCTSQFGINTVTLYAPPEEVGKDKVTVFIKVLTQNGRGEVGDPDDGAFFKQTAYWIYLDIDEEASTCTLHIAKTSRPVPDELIKYCSQCKYRHENEDSVRDASLFHYQSSLIAKVGEDAVVTVVGHKNSVDFHYRTETTYDGFTVNLFGSLSEDLSTFYFSLYKYFFAGPYIPPIERWLAYRVYDLNENEEANSWDMRCNGSTPIGYTYKDNIITRDGKIGCWATADTVVEYLPSPVRTHKSCLDGDLLDCQSSSGYTTAKVGWRAMRTYKTFDLESRSFVDKERMTSFHMSYLAKDYVACKATDEYEYLQGSHWNAWNCECTCIACEKPDPVQWPQYQGCYPQSTSMHTTNKADGSGGNRNYNLYNGLELLNAIIDEEEGEDLELHYNPEWDDFWEGVRYRFEKELEFSQNCPPTPSHSVALGWGHRENLTGEVTLTDPVIDATIVQMVTDTTGTEDNYKGNCGHDGTATIWMRHQCFYGYFQFVCMSETENQWLCDEDLLEEGPEVDTFKRRNLGPIDFEMNMSGDIVLDLIKASFISYDQVSKCTVRGMNVCFNCYPDNSLEGEWKILLDHPILGEWDIAGELQNLLANEECNIIETIVFVPEVELDRSIFS